MSTASCGDDEGAVELSAADDQALWVEAMGEKVFGLGSMSRVCTGKAAGSSSSCAAASKRTRMEEEVTQLKHLLVQKDEEIKTVNDRLAQKDEQIRQMDERQKSFEAQMDERQKSFESQMQRVLQRLHLNEERVPQLPPAPPTSKIDDGKNDGRHNEDEIAADDDDLIRCFINADDEY